MQRTRLAIVVVSALTLVGCYWQITIRTTIAPDGRTERRVSVSGDRTGGVADEFVVPTSRPWVERDVGKDAYTVRGTFGTPATMPSGYARRVEATGETAPSRIEWRREDRVFYTLYEYRETITDIVTADRFDSAADELIDVAVGLGCSVLEARLGDTYDVGRLTTWLRGDGRALLRTLGWTWLAYSAAGEQHALAAVMADRVDTAAIARVVGPMFRRRGIDIDLAGLLVDGNDTKVRVAVGTFLGDRVRLRSAPERPLSERERAQVVALLLPEDAARAPGQDDGKDTGPAQRYLVTRYGSREKAEAATGRLLVHVMGAYCRVLGPSFRFRAPRL